MAVDVLEGLLEEDDEVVQVSSDPATVIGSVTGSVTWEVEEPRAFLCVFARLHTTFKSAFSFLSTGASADETTSEVNISSPRGGASSRILAALAVEPPGALPHSCFYCAAALIAALLESCSKRRHCSALAATRCCQRAADPPPTSSPWLAAAEAVRSRRLPC